MDKRTHTVSRLQGGELPTIEAILEKGASAVMRYGIRVLVIDPYNFVHNDKRWFRDRNDKQHTYQSTVVRKATSVFGVLCRTSNKPFVRDGKKNVCTGVDISGSMAWFSKADMGLTVYRGRKCRDTLLES